MGVPGLCPGGYGGRSGNQHDADVMTQRHGGLLAVVSHHTWTKKATKRVKDDAQLLV